MKNLRIIVLFCIGFLVFCEQPSNSPQWDLSKRGQLVSSDTLLVYQAPLVDQLISMRGYDLEIDVEYGVVALELVYYTVDSYDNIVKASGAVLVPNTREAKPLLSLQHGTVFGRTSVASVSPLSSTEGMVGIVLASTGYQVCVPDYLGFGVSRQMHPYIHAQTNGRVVVDMLRAFSSWQQEHNLPPSTDLFLGGYSEGGYVTMAAHRCIEQSYSGEFDLTASAPCAGPYDLEGFTYRLLEHMSYPVPANLAFLLTSYDHIYELNALSSMFQSPYDQKIKTLFDGSQSFTQINSQLPDSIKDLLNPDFVQSILDSSQFDPGCWQRIFLDAIRENTLLDWAPQAPMRLYHGKADKTVDVKNSITAHTRFQKNGARQVDLILYEGLDHMSAALPAITDMYVWFQTLRQDASMARR